MSGAETAADGDKKGGDMSKANCEHCVRVLLDSHPALVLCLDDCPGVHIVPVVLDASSAAAPENVGRLEFQVSDGLPGARSTSYDCYRLSDAVVAARRMFNEMRAVGKARP